MPPKRQRSAATEELAKGRSAATEGLTKGPWTAVEDEVLMEYVREHGEGDWNRVRLLTGIPRSGKSCRLRWLNHLRPDLKKGSFSHEEERLVLELHAVYGNKWSLIATQLPGRTDNDIKNFWNTRAKRYESAGWPLYLPGPVEANPSTGRAPILGQTSCFPPSPGLHASNILVPPGFVHPNGDAARPHVQGATPAFLPGGSSLTRDLPPLIQYQYAGQSSEMIARPGFSPLHGADLGAYRHMPSGTRYLPCFGPFFGTPMPELPSGQHLQTGQGQIVNTKQHPHPLAAEHALFPSFGLRQASSTTTNGGLDPLCNEMIRADGQSAWPAFLEQAPDGRESSLEPDLNPEVCRGDAIRPDALLGLCHFFP